MYIRDSLLYMVSYRKQLHRLKMMTYEDIVRHQECIVNHLESHNWLTAKNLSRKLGVQYKVAKYILRSMSSIKCVARNPYNTKNKRFVWMLSSHVNV